MYSDIVIDVGQIPSSLLSLTEPVGTSDHESIVDAHRLGAHETTMISDIPQSEELVIAPGEGKQSILNDQYSE